METESAGGKPVRIHNLIQIYKNVVSKKKKLR